MSNNKLIRKTAYSWGTFFLAVVFSFSALLFGCASAPPVADNSVRNFFLSGKVSLEGKGASGAEVLLYDPLFHLPPALPPFAKTLTDDNGDFSFDVPEGVYLAVARKDDMFSFYGRNPVRLTTDTRGLALPLLPIHGAAKKEAKPDEEGITGRVMQNGVPVLGAQVFAYLHASRGLRGPGYGASEPTGMDGTYSINLPPGTYFIAARQRGGKWTTGTLRPGDLFGVLPVFPLVISPGEQIVADFETIEVPSRKQMSKLRGAFAKISGRIIDGKGRPLPGMRAALYANAQLFDRPLAASEPADEEGRFFLETPLSGTFTLGARQFLGGPPQSGELVGFYEGEDGVMITVELDKHLSDLDIIVQNVP